MENACIVTACDRNYLWGAILLIASLRMRGVKTPIHVVTTDFTDEEKQLLAQFENTQVFQAPAGGINIRTQKPTAIKTSDAQHITWMDSDCIVSADITKWLTPDDKKLHIRLRSPDENKWVFRSRYMPSPTDGGIPEYILAIWQVDIREREKSAITTMGLTYCFTLHRETLPFIERWRDQMAQVLPDDLLDVTDITSPAYFMTDESVLNSLLAFADDAPEPGEFYLDQDTPPLVIHFGMNGKPWQRWQTRHLEHFDLVMSIMNWLQAYDYALPAIPWTLQKKNKARCYAVSYGSRLTKLIYKYLKSMLLQK